MYSDYVKSDFRSFKSDKQFITAPIYYVNGAPHLGHLYTSIAVDILHRFMSIFGESYFSIGTDEHGQKVEQSAQKNNCEVQKYVDDMYAPFHQLMKVANIQYDSFIRTSSEKHKSNVLHFWNKLLDSGDTYEDSYKGWYATRDEQFYAEDEVEDRYIKNSKRKVAKISGSPVEWMEEKCTFFKLSKYNDELLDYYKKNKSLIGPNARYNEVIGMLEARIPDLAITRSRFSWGISCGNGQVIYVWVDALSNYITAMGDNVDYWINDMIHIIGKDILKFHAIYWPALLLSTGYPMPKRIYAHGWWTVNEDKMSKSLGNVVEPFDLIEKYGIDPVRYCIMREMSFGQDGDFSHDRMKNRVNTELVNVIGNLVQRVLAFTWKEFGETLTINDLEDQDLELLKNWDECLENSFEAMKKQQIHVYLEEVRKVIVKTNQYIDFTAPWKCESEEKKRILAVGIECIKRLALIIYPVMPGSSEKILEMIGCDCKISNWFVPLQQKALDKPSGLFNRI
ncbi:methionine--tRNA ligase [Candidatus Cytomitobacter primus]|uniref:methionine--tRNA ligase n=1 Tax=Candidatus Cytomitobacter primus TaxID=2066024 RepID=UPI0016535CA2|nr:methionine--tRNA ligase [Candidatus Cytomitobacter primus]